jgi:NYN domain
MSFTETGSRSAQGRRVGQRRIVLVDIENVVGGSSALCDHVLWAKEVVEECISARPDDQVVVGVAPAGLLDLACAWTRVRYVMRPGLDGADLVLLEVLGENIADRFAEVVLVSGDGIFADAVAELASQGVCTTVVAHPDALSRRLELAADAVRFLPDRPAPQPASTALCKEVA